MSETDLEHPDDLDTPPPAPEAPAVGPDEAAAVAEKLLETAKGWLAAEQPQRYENALAIERIDTALEALRRRAFNSAQRA